MRLSTGLLLVSFSRNYSVAVPDFDVRFLYNGDVCDSTSTISFSSDV